MIMGLDIAAYKNLVPAPDGDSELRNYDVSVFVNPEFPGRCTEFVDGGLYNADKGIDFCAGSYSGYNTWRNNLATLAGYGGAEGAWKREGGPFWELINFSDCEGALGTAVCAKLYRDFAEYQNLAKQTEGEESRFYQKYILWMQASEDGAQNGIIKFF